MNLSKTLAMLATLLLTTPLHAEWVDQYHVVWDAPSTTSEDSMPLAGGVLGLNVWVQEGDLLFLMASPNNLDESGFQTKLGRFRLHLTPAVFAKEFRQELDLARSEIIVSGKTADERRVRVRLWCDVFQPVIHIDVAAETPVEAVVSYETWSDYEAKFVDGGLQWMRRLASPSPLRERHMKLQGMAEFASAVPDPLKDLTTGGRLVANGLVAAGQGVGKFANRELKTWSLKTAQPIQKLKLTVALRMEQDPSASEWEARLADFAHDAAAQADAARPRSLAWWKEFWDRSRIIVNPGGDAADRAWLAGRNYQLIRYQTAANRNGRMMTLFNGGMFVCTDDPGNPDVRNWGGCQCMAQNQRLIYWPMLRSGDSDLLKVALDFYRDRTEVSRLHAQKFWGVDGVAWPESFSIFGMDSIGSDAEGRSLPPHLKYHHTSGIEFALMMLEFGRYTGRDIREFLDAPLGVIQYYDRYYQKINQGLDKQGRLVIYPSDANETYHGCRNNTDVIAGLTALTQALLALPADDLDADQRKYLTEFQSRIPPFPIKEIEGRRYYAAAESWDWVLFNPNMEFPQMYVCFPFNIAALGRPGIELAEATWDVGAIRPNIQKQNHCWYQTAINLARLGRTAAAARHTLDKLTYPTTRFPTFYKTGRFDQTPDTDHGGAAMIALQEMILQTDGRRILLCPAWPASWDCDFKLHAPYQTVVEGRVVAGQVVVDRVTPASRQADIEIFPLKGSASQGKLVTASSLGGRGTDPSKAVDGDRQTRWGTVDGSRSGWLEIDLGRPTQISRAVIEQVFAPSVSKFSLEAHDDKGAWRSVATGDAIGERLELKFEPVTAQRFRLNIHESSRPHLNIEEFQLYNP